MNPRTKRCSSIFDLRPLTPKIGSPKFDQKSPITRLLWQIHQRCLSLIGGIRGWPIQWNHTKCCGANPCCHGNEIWARRGVQSHTGLSVCPSVCLSQTLLLFCFESFLDHQFSMTKTTKLCSSIFDLGPLTPKTYSPKFAQNRL